MTPETMRPQSAEEVASILRAANEEGRDLSTSRLTAISGNTLRLDMTALNAIEKYEPGDLTLRVQAGARVVDVLAALGPHRQMLPLDMPNAQDATIGGMLASAAHGPMRASFGGVREYCIGIEFAIADGTLAHAGGMVVKNVAGYDLMKLLIGSRGTLGIIASASFKVFPIARSTSTFVATFANSEEAIQFAQTVRRSALAPLRLELASPGQTTSAGWSLLITAAGSDAVIARYRRELGGKGPGGVRRLVELTAEEDATVWKALNDLYANAFVSGASRLQVDVSTTLTATVAACKALEDIAARFGAQVSIHGRVGIGHLIGIFHPAFGADPCVMLQALRSIMPPDTFVQSIYPRAPIDLSQNAGMRVVKRALDPKNILNPGATSL